MNQRKRIRHDFQALLRNQTRAMANVFRGRSRDIWQEELPAINVWAGEEEAELSGEAPRRYKRMIELTVELYLESVYDIDDDADDFMSEVQDLIDGADLFTLSNVIDDVVYVSAHHDYDPTGAKQRACVSLKYTVSYFSYAGVLVKDLPEFQEIDAKWDTTGVTEDIVTLP